MSGNAEDDANREDGNGDDSDGKPDDARDRELTGSTSLSLDATLEILAHSDRRAIISYLRDADDQTATIDELASHLVTLKAEQSDERPGRDHVRTTLFHIHIPKLEDAGLIDYDARSKEIRYWGSERLETWHDRIRNPES